MTPAPGPAATWQRRSTPRVCEQFCAELESLGATVARGIFGADMQLSLVNDGPVTMVLDS